MKCRLCGKGAQEIGGYLHRVNEKGVIGIWECRPNCHADLPFETNLLLAIAAEDDVPEAPATEMQNMKEK